MCLIGLAVICIFAAGIGALFVHDLAAARARLVGRSEVTDTSDGKMEYAISGNGQPVLAIHGAGGGFDQALDVVGVLKERGYRLVAPSRFGYLRSAMPSHPTTAMQADAYAELLNQLGIHRVFVIGISAGAWSALQFAIRHPDRCRAVVLLSPADYLPPGMPNQGGALVRLFFNSDFASWVTLRLMPYVPGPMSRDILGVDSAVLSAAAPDERERIRQTMDHLLPVSPRVPGMRFDIKTAAVREPYAIDKIACPVLAISAQDDAFGTAARAREIVTQVPRGKLIIYPSGGHPLVGHYTDVLQQVTEFFSATGQ